MARAWMPIYWGDYLADTQHLNAEQHGMYLLLIAHYWQAGELPEDESVLRTISRCPARSWNRNWSIIRRFFVSIKERGLVHARIDAELEKSKKISEVRAAAVGRRWNKADTNEPTNEIQKNTQSQSQSQETKKLRSASKPRFDWEAEDWVDVEPLIAVWEQTHPEVDVQHELRKARAWCLMPHNYAKARAITVWSRFLNSWMSRQSKTVPPKAPESALSSPFEGLA